ncbi:MAG: MFS transporter [Vicinamibacterales bacterium]
MGRARGVPDLPRAVWLLGWVSLATDAASEAIYPLLPFFLTSVLGAGAGALGLIEGAAEAVNSLVKLASGRRADRAASKRPLVLLGYSLSSAVRPLVALTATWPQVFVLRFLDRVGKGIRSAPRDAMLAALAPRSRRGLVFGFHRGMDHAGAVVGPVLASVFLLAMPGAYRTLFLLTLIPGALAVALIFFVREPPAPVEPAATSRDARGGLPPSLTRVFAVIALFTLGNSTDAYLLLRLTEAAGGPTYIPLVWAALHVVKSVSSVLGGAWSDRAGRVGVIATGWGIYAIVYAGFATTESWWGLMGWFLLYGLYFGLTEGVEKALVADLAPAEARGFAFGLYTAVQGLGAFAASVLFGALWVAFGPGVAFTTGAGLATAALLALLALRGSLTPASTPASPI